MTNAAKNQSDPTSIAAGSQINLFSADNYYKISALFNIAEGAFSIILDL